MILLLKYCRNIFLVTVLLFSVTKIWANETEVDSTKSEGQVTNEKKFKPGDFIIDHVLDNHEWHIANFNGTHISVPLPVILYSRSEKNSGFHVFMSSKFHHGEAAYDGFKLEMEGPHKGKIIEVNEAGEIDETAPYLLDLSITKVVLELLLVLALFRFTFYIPLT